MLSMNRVAALGLCAVMIAASSLLVAQNREKLAAGTAVFAEWRAESWYHGKLGAACDGGFMVIFDDGDQKCCEPGEIVPDREAKKEQVKADTRVLAQWTDGKFYPAVVTAVKGDLYDVTFEDEEKATVILTQLRLRPAAVPVKKVEITIRKGGSPWASIAPDGTIRIQGSVAGSYTDDGMIRNGGSIVGQIQESGTIRKNGSIVGQIEPNGTLRNGGSIIGDIEPGGTIRLNGSIWGSANTGTYRNIRAVAAVLVFFTTDFGY